MFFSCLSPSLIIIDGQCPISIFDLPVLSPSSVLDSDKEDSSPKTLTDVEDILKVLSPHPVEDTFSGFPKLNSTWAEAEFSIAVETLSLSASLKRVKSTLLTLNVVPIQPWGKLPDYH